MDKILIKFYLDKAHAVNTPIKETAIFELKTEGEAWPSKRERYQGITGYISFFIVETRLDIAFNTFVASFFAKNPGHQYTKS